MSIIDTSKEIQPRLMRGSEIVVESIIVLLILVYNSIGAFPLIPIENDSMRISLGAQSHSLYGDYQYAYRWDSQSGTYKLIELITDYLESDFFQTFAIITFISSLIFIIISSVFLKRITGNRFVFAFLSILLFQETIISGYYPNSNMMAAAFLAIAFLLAMETENVLCIITSGVTFAAACWMRFDTILMGLAFPILLLSRQIRHIKSFILFCLVTAISGIFLFSASGVSLIDIFGEYSQHSGNNINIRETLNNYSTIFTLVIILCYGVGIYQLYLAKKWRLILLSTIAPLPLVFAYALSVTTPKYLLYASPLWAIPVCYSLNILKDSSTLKRNQAMIFIVILLFTGQYIFSPPYELALERSTIVYTADEARLRGAIVYSPIYYAKYKHEKLIDSMVFQDKLSEYLQIHTDAYIISQDWMANQWVLYYLQSNNYKIQETEDFAVYLEDGQKLTLTNGINTVNLVRWRPEIVLKFPVTLEQTINDMKSVLYIGPDYTTTDYAQKSFLSRDFEWQILSDWGRFETILFTHK